MVLFQDGAAGGISLNEKGNYTKNSANSGIEFLFNFNQLETYVLKYTFEFIDGVLINIGGHNDSFDTIFYVYDNNDVLIGQTTDNKFVFETPVWKTDDPKIYKIVARYTRKVATDDYPYLFIQPNKGLDEPPVEFKLTDVSLVLESNYFGFEETEFVSPTLIQNFINNYNFDSGAGWTAATKVASSGEKRPLVENIYGRFFNQKFYPIVDDFLEGSYLDTYEYKPYMKM
jgi:hypothetical protein